MYSSKMHRLRLNGCPVLAPAAGGPEFAREPVRTPHSLGSVLEPRWKFIPFTESTEQIGSAVRLVDIMSTSNMFGANRPVRCAFTSGITVMGQKIIISTVTFDLPLKWTSKYCVFNRDVL